MLEHFSAEYEPSSLSPAILAAIHECFGGQPSSALEIFKRLEKTASSNAEVV